MEFYLVLLIATVQLAPVRERQVQSQREGWKILIPHSVIINTSQLF